jgi:hypothetical protein
MAASTAGGFEVPETRRESMLNEDAACTFLDAPARRTAFGMLAGGEAEGMLVNRGGLAWGINDDQYVKLWSFDG